MMHSATSFGWLLGWAVQLSSLAWLSLDPYSWARAVSHAGTVLHHSLRRMRKAGLSLGGEQAPGALDDSTIRHPPGLGLPQSLAPTSLHTRDVESAMKVGPPVGLHTDEKIGNEKRPAKRPPNFHKLDNQNFFNSRGPSGISAFFLFLSTGQALQDGEPGNSWETRPSSTPREQDPASRHRVPISRCFHWSVAPAVESLQATYSVISINIGRPKTS